jgi:hypothetical protein
MGLSLISRSDYKIYAGISSNTQDVLIDSLIVKISALVKSICNRTFIDYVNDAKVDYYDGGTSTLLVEEYPVLNITSLEYSADYGNTYTTLTEFIDYAVSRINYSIISIKTNGFPYAVNGYRLTYTAGFTEIPEDLKLAIFDLVTYYIKSDMAIHSNRNQGANTVQVEYVTTTSLPSHIRRVLDLHAAHYN